MEVIMNVSLLEVVELFSHTLRQIMSIPELALFAGTALLLIIVSIFSWIVLRSKKM